MATLKVAKIALRRLFQASGVSEFFVTEESEAQLDGGSQEEPTLFAEENGNASGPTALPEDEGNAFSPTTSVEEGQNP